MNYSVVILIRIADTQFAHGSSLGSGDLKLSPSFFNWYRGNEKQTNDILFITESCFHLADKYFEKIKIAWLIEPRSISPSAYEWIRKPVNYSKFSLILTHNKELIDYFEKISSDGGLSVPVYWYPFGGCWIYPEERKIYTKTKNISIIASSKRHTEGHRLRHEAIERFGDRISGIFNDPYKYLGPRKITALKEYQYSVIIENEQSNDFFTEKIIDCFVTGTIPVYWGTKNIGKYFNTEGFFQFETIKELGELLNILGKNSYDQRLNDGHIYANYVIAQKYVCPEDWIWQHIPVIKQRCLNTDGRQI